MPLAELFEAMLMEYWVTCARMIAPFIPAGTILDTTPFVD